MRQYTLGLGYERHLHSKSHNDLQPLLAWSGGFHRCDKLVGVELQPDRLVLEVHAVQ